MAHNASPWNGVKTGRARRAPDRELAVRFRPGRSSATYATGLLVVAYAINLMDRMILAVLAQPIQDELRITDAQIGLLTGFAFVAVYAAAGLPLARLADRVGRRWVLAGSLAVWSAMTALSGLARTFPQLALARLGVGVGEAGSLPASVALISDLYPAQRRALPLAWMSGGACMGVALGLSLGGLVASLYGWRVALLVAGLPGLLLAVLIAGTLPEPAREAPTPAAPAATFWVSLRRLLARPSFRWLLACQALANFILSGLVSWLPIFMIRSHGQSLMQTGALLGLTVATGMAVGGVGGAWLLQRGPAAATDRSLKISGLCMLAAFPCLVAALLAPEVHVAVGLLLVTGTLTGVASGPVLAGQQGVADVKDRALAAGVGTFVANYIGTGLFPFLIGLSSDALAPRFGAESVRFTLLGASVMVVLAGLALLRAARAYRRDVGA